MQYLTPKSFFVTILLIVFTLLQLNAQYDVDRKHVLHIEAVGRSFIFGTLNYEYMPHDKFSFGLGAGFMFRNKFTITNQNSSLNERGIKRRSGWSQVFYGNYFIGKNNHKLQLTAGLTNFLELEKSTFPSGTQKSRLSELRWNLGFGYQVSHKRSIFRITAYRLALPGIVSEEFKGIPWLGITYGIRL